MTAAPCFSHHDGGRYPRSPTMSDVSFTRLGPFTVGIVRDPPMSILIAKGAELTS